MKPSDARPRIALSACLLGRRVRYDGGHKHVPALVAALEETAELVDVCPEVEAGLGVPRPPMRLEAGSDGAEGPRAVVADDGRDLTFRLRAFSRRRVAELRALGIDGVVLKSRSPSCALGTAPLLRGGVAAGRADGLFARAVRSGLGGVPMADEEDLAHPARRARFLAAVRARWKERCGTHRPASS